MSTSSSEVALEHVSEFKDDADQDEKPSPQENKETVAKEELHTVETEVEWATTHNNKIEDYIETQQSDKLVKPKADPPSKNSCEKIVTICVQRKTNWKGTCQPTTVSRSANAPPVLNLFQARNN